MVTYPIVIRTIAREEGRRILVFPDFPGCKERFSVSDLPDGEGFAQTVIARAREVAANYLLPSSRGPGWIIRRLQDGMIVAQPRAYPYEARDNDLLSDVDLNLPENVCHALEFMWLRQDLHLNLGEMAKVADMDPLRLRLIEQCRVKPNHHDRAKLRNLKLRSETRIRTDRTYPDEDDGSQAVSF